ncbi:MAG TPA: putative inorganic carbon transporter subunit DabA, partial [bacterium]|nr:putative inorganic carbon transporter subunit DabA [bacterium]
MSSTNSEHTHSEAMSPEDEIRRIIDHTAHLLPAQGPIRVFVHHNTLHAFEDLPFEEAIIRAGERFGCRPYMEEEDYRREWLQGRILTGDLRAVLQEDLRDSAPLPRGPQAEGQAMGVPGQETKSQNSPGAEAIAGSTSRLELRLALLAGGLQEPNDKELDWRLNESDAPMDQALWEACLDLVNPLGPLPLPPPRKARYRDKLLALTGEDMDALVQPLLIRFCAAFCDQGIAYWRLPSRSLGFFGSFRRLYQGLPLPDAWLKGFNFRLRGRDNPASSIVASLGNLGIPQEEWEAYIEEMMLAMKGWPGMIHQNEERPDRVLIPSPPGSLLEYAAVRLLLEEQAVAHLTRRFKLSLADLRKVPSPAPLKTVGMRAFALYQLAQHFDWPVETIRTSPAEALLREIESFSSLERRRLFHLAYERRHRNQTLDALAHHRWKAAGAPRFQAVCCIDEREESFRRHLEETEPSCETFGTAGFFGLAMYYRGIEDAHAVPLCPILIQPTHSVEEVPLEVESQSFRHAVGHAAYAFHVGSRTGIRGALLSGFFGTLAAFPLALRVFFPRHAAKMRVNLRSSSAKTRLKWNYTTEEEISVVRKLLEETGIKNCLSKLVVIVGHGSSSLNNPHESAHDCGACGGGRGGPNARAFALMANDPQVRESLGIPKDTIFVGAYHNTC